MFLFIHILLLAGALFFYFGGLDYLYTRWGFGELEEAEKKLY